MARNRKRAKERQARRPERVGGAGSGLNGDNAAPEPLAHATPDGELADVQMALGRPELADSTPEERALNEQELEAEEAEYEDLDEGGSGTAVAGLGDGHAAGEQEAHPAARANLFTRVIGFLQGSWHELQRVQWPDRRQVMQATGVVIGFVIVAGVFLGVADVLAQHLMNYVLEGHW
jgi:preprotein translocase SecE subunit